MNKRDMTYNIYSLWGIYILVLILSFIILSLSLGQSDIYYQTIGQGLILFLVTIFGAIAVIIGTIWFDSNQFSTTDKIWLTILYGVAFLLPMFIMIYIIKTGEYIYSIGGDDSCGKTTTYVRQNIKCNTDTGICEITKKKIYQGDNVTKILYKSNRDKE